ncbi:metal ABC transporter permease, partial [bacterium]|nr:metal ABC transporter permease [bacterium]
VLAFIVVGYLGVTLEGLSFVWSLFLGALLAGLFTAIGISLVSRFARAKEDSAIGIVFTAMFALGVVLISLQPKGTHFDLACFLFGEPLSIKSEDFTSIAIITPLVLGYVIFGYRGLKILSFDPQMAEAIGIRVHVLHYVFMGFLAGTVVAALRTVGVIMSIAMLITPAATAYQLTDRLSTMLVLSGLFGAVAAVMGFLMAFVLNIPTGPSMVLFATAIFILAVIFSPKYGLLEAAFRKRSVRRHILEEDVLKALVKQENPLSTRSLAERLEAAGADMSAAVRALKKSGMVAAGAAGLSLTDAGRTRGTNLVRSHRL